jgi:hypothetical protein
MCFAAGARSKLARQMTFSCDGHEELQSHGGPRKRVPKHGDELYRCMSGLAVRCNGMHFDRCTVHYALFIERAYTHMRSPVFYFHNRRNNVGLDMCAVRK